MSLWGVCKGVLFSFCSPFLVLHWLPFRIPPVYFEVAFASFNFSSILWC